MIRQKTRQKVILIYYILFFTLKFQSSYAWGFFAHKLINRQATFSLPPSLFNFYKFHIYAITINATNPDSRRCVIEGEAEKHFIDLDHYSIEDRANMPYRWDAAIQKFSKESLLRHGICPWNIIHMKHRLTLAFKNKDTKQIIKISADIAHYIADANVPLHTSENYNGQLTNQHGIHAFWESRLPEIFADGYDLFVGKASYIADLDQRVWTAINKAHGYVREVLDIEKDLSEKFPPAQKYSFEQRGATLQKVYSIEYSKAYHDKLNGMVEKQMRSSIKMVADIWYTCWVDAGEPNLDNLIHYDDELKKMLIDEFKSEEDLIKQEPKIKSYRDCG